MRVRIIIARIDCELALNSGERRSGVNKILRTCRKTPLSFHANFAGEQSKSRYFASKPEHHTAITYFTDDIGYSTSDLSIGNIRDKRVNGNIFETGVCFQVERREC